MKQRMLGGRLSVPAIAMGCMRLADAKESPDRVIGTALELGITEIKQNIRLFPFHTLLYPYKQSHL